MTPCTRKILLAVMCAAGTLALAACNNTPATKPLPLGDAQAGRVSDALGAMPKATPGITGVPRTFFATIRAAGQRTTATGLLRYYSPRDYRVTAITEMGVLLFDGRLDWAGVHVRRAMDGLPQVMVEALIADFSRAFEVPQELEGLAAGPDALILKRQPGDGLATTWTFDPATGKLREVEVSMGFLDTLRIEIKSYNEEGWPKELHMIRRARAYEIWLTFTDQKV